MGRHGYVLGVAAHTALLLSACGDGSAPKAWTFTGRAFDAETGKPIPALTLSSSEGNQTKSAEDGSFKLGHRAAATVLLTGELHATSSKEMPAADAHAELYAKGIDAQKELAQDEGATLTTKLGVTVELPEKSLQTAEGTPPKTATLAVASVDPRKSTALSSLPGDFDAETKGGRRGKVSVEAPLYVSASAGKEPLELSAGKKLKASFPARGARTSSTKLFRFDEQKQAWKESADVVPSDEKATGEVYRLELDGFGWWSVGEFFDALSCVRGCVRDDGAPARGARVLASGIDHFTQVTEYTGADGCFALDVKAGAEVSLRVQGASSVSNTLVVTTSETPMRVSEDRDACQDLGTIELEPQDSDAACPLGFGVCGESCVDLQTDPEHCGACEMSCQSAAGSLLCIAGNCACPDGQACTPQVLDDAGVRADASMGMPDASPNLPDAGGGSPEASVLDAGETCGICEDVVLTVGTGGGIAENDRLAGCCTDQVVCGALLTGTPFALPVDRCITRDQPGTPQPACPDYLAGSEPNDMRLDGCCRSDGVCGYDTASALFFSYGSADLGWGCAAYTDIVPGTTEVPLPCTNAICGDTLVGAGEACDDGNQASADGCSASCQLEAGFQCPTPGNPCTTVCGDGLVRGAEGCDDGDTTSGDGCSAGCQVEAGYSCPVEGQACVVT